MPVIGHTAAFVRDPFGFVRRTVESTGDMFEMNFLGKDVYVVARPDCVETALLDRESFAKLEDFHIAFDEALLAVEGDQWRRQRHAMEDFFAPTRVREFTKEMMRTTVDRTDGWTAGETIDLDDEMRSIALSNLFEIVFGQSLSASESDALAADADALNRWFEPTSWVLPQWVPTPARREFRRGSARLREWARSVLEEAGDLSSDGSLLARLVRLRDDPTTEFDRDEVVDQVVGMVFAGHETTSLALTYAFHQIGSYPTVAERFYGELDAALEDRTTADLQELTYVEKIINETLRLYPPVHAIPRVTTEPVRLGEYVIPEGKPVLLSLWSIHRDPRFYDDPLEFDPDRWTDDSPRTRGAEFIPFGSGPRTCIGRHFARLEMKAVLAAVGREYRLVPEDDLEVFPQMTTQPAAPVRMRIRNRT